MALAVCFLGDGICHHFFFMRSFLWKFIVKEISDEKKKNAVRDCGICLFIKRYIFIKSYSERK